MNRFTPVKGENYKKDRVTGVLINNDDSQYKKILEHRKKLKQVEADKRELQELKNDMADLKTMMAQILKKVENG